MERKNKITYLTIGIGMILFPFILSAQEKKITGKIIDTLNRPIPGAQISIKNRNSTTTSNNQGLFELMSISRLDTLQIHSIGFKDIIFPLNEKTHYEFTLHQNEQDLDEIVVIGYGKMQKKTISSAITSVKPKDFNSGNISNPAQLLQGKVPGLSIVAPQGNPNGTFNIRLRGLSTLGENTQPLVIIDGIVGPDIASVDPNDIASIDILKDGAAAAIYGTRGSSGVIIITTKTGNVGKSLINFNTYLASESIDRSLPIMTNDKYLEYGGSDYGSRTDWMDIITRNAWSQSHNLNLSGGLKNFNYMAAVNYRNNQGILLKTGNKQANGRANIQYISDNDKFKLDLNLSLSNKDANLGFDDVFRSAIIMPPTAPITSTDPVYEKYGGYFQNLAHELFNPMAIINQNSNDQKTRRSTYNLQGTYNFLQNLYSTMRISYNDENYSTGQYISRQSLYGSGVDRKGIATVRQFDNDNLLFEWTGNYEKNFGKLQTDLLGGYSYQDFKSTYQSIQTGNFLTDEFGYNNLSASKDLADGLSKAESNKESNKLISFFGRLNLNYDNTYYLMASLRREGSTRFGAGNKWGNFYGISTAIDIAKLIQISKIDQLKLRVSYGLTGALPDQSYLSQQLYGPGSNLSYYLYNGVFTPVYNPQSNPNPNLKWENKAETNLGVDYSILSGRIRGTFDLYNRKTTDALIRLDVPVPPNLYPTTILNAGVIINRGFEAGIETQQIVKTNFSWSSKFTFSTNKTNLNSLSLGDLKYGTREVGGLPAPLTGNVVRVEEGKQLGQIIGWKYEGVDEKGNYIIQDQNGDNQINEQDQTVIGRGLPKGEFGFGNTFTYKNFDLNFLFRAVYGHNLINLHRTMFEQVSRISTYNLINTKYFDENYKGPVAYNSNYVENGSFIKLDNISLGYNVPIKTNSSFSKIRAFVTGQNLFYITGYSGVDPEPRYMYENNVLAPGVEPLNSWVTTSTFSIGLNLTIK